MRVGIFGGAFNPIHLGHLVLAETARDALSLDRVLFIPTLRPPHKSDWELLDGAVRLKLIQLAIRDQPAFAASAIELERPGVSYSLETVMTIRRELPQAQLFLLIGEDMLAVPWRGWGQLKRLCTIVAARRRTGASPPRLQRTTGRGGRRREARLEWLDMPKLAISSSQIRDRVRRGRSVRYLVPGPVERYIRQHELYRR